MAPKQKTKKKNFNDNEREVLLSEVEARKYVLFKSVSTGVTGTGKKEAWDAVTQAVNVVSPEIRTVAEVKKKWFDMKFEAKRRISVQQRKKDTGGGQGPPDLSAFDERMAAIIGQSSLSGIIERSEGESDLIQEQLQHGNMLKSKSLF